MILAQIWNNIHGIILFGDNSVNHIYLNNCLTFLIVFNYVNHILCDNSM